MQERAELRDPHASVVQRKVRFALIEPRVPREVDHIVIAGPDFAHDGVVGSVGTDEQAHARAWDTPDERRDLLGLVA